MYQKTFFLQNDILERYDTISDAYGFIRDYENLTVSTDAKRQSEGQDVEEELSRERTAEEELVYQSLTDNLALLEEGRTEFAEELRTLG